MEATIRTKRFKDIKLSIDEKGDCVLSFSGLLDEPVEYLMSPSELNMFLMECNNLLYEAEGVKTELRAARDLLREQRR